MLFPCFSGFSSARRNDVTTLELAASVGVGGASDDIELLFGLGANGQRETARNLDKDFLAVSDASSGQKSPN